MGYCGQFGCKCCSASCKKCGETKWHHHLEDGVCRECLQADEIKRLRAALELIADSELTNYAHDDFIEVREIAANALKENL